MKRQDSKLPRPSRIAPADQRATGAGRMNLTQILVAVGREAETLGRSVNGAQDRLSHLARWHRQSSETMEDLQSLDLLSQNLFGLADFLRDLASSVPEDWTADVAKAARVVKVSDLACRLSDPGHDAASQVREELGAVELFGHHDA